MSDYAPTMGAGDPLEGRVPDAVSDFSRKYIAGYHVVVLMILVIIVIYLLYRTFYAAAESFNPTATLRLVNQDQAYINAAAADNTARAIMAMGRGAFEGMEGQGKGADMGQGKGVAAIGALQGVPVVSAATDPSSPLMPGSAAWQVLNSPAFNCGGRDLQQSSNAWSWMNRVAHGEAMSSKPQDDADFSKALAGL